MSAKVRFFVAGGTLSAEAGSYVERAADESLLEALLARKFCYVLNSRQMGKSSLCVRTMKRLGAGGVRTAFVDLTKIGGRNVTSEQWYAGIAIEIGRALELRPQILAYWNKNADLSPLQRLFGTLREIVLEKLAEPIAIFFDEIDATRSLAFGADEFFAAIRECFNRRVQDPAFNRLTFCLLGVAVPSDLISNPASTPFNIGERIYLKDFTLQEAKTLATGLTHEHLLERIFYWTNGHPYLTQSLCMAVAADPQINTPSDVDALVKRDLLEPGARETNINLADVANRALHAGDQEPDPSKFCADLLCAYEGAWKGKPLPDDEANHVTALLKLSGIMGSNSNGLQVRNRIYERVFDRGWIRDHMPGQELRRQRRALWLGVLRTATIAIAVLGAMGALAWKNAQLAKEALQQKNATLQANRKLDYRAYVADMMSLSSMAEMGGYPEIAATLRDNRDSPYRGFEWFYWFGRIHPGKEEYALEEQTNGNFVSGVFSTDGKQLMVSDSKLHTSVIVDRATAKPVAEFKEERNETVFPGKGRWLRIRHTSSNLWSVADALTGSPICSVGDQSTPGSLAYSLNGDFGFDVETRTGDALPTQVSAWNLISGRRIGLYRCPNGTITPGAWVMARDRPRIAFVEVSRKTGGAGPTSDVVVWDANAGAEADRFHLRAEQSVEDIDASGNRLILRNSKYARLYRDVKLHRTLPVVCGDVRGQPDWVKLYVDGRFTAEQYRDSHVVLREFPSGRKVAERDGVWSLVDRPGSEELIACADSAIVYQMRDPYAGPAIGTADALIRLPSGQVLACSSSPARVTALQGPNLSTRERTASPPGTTWYNSWGSWVQISDPTGQSSTFARRSGGNHRLKLPVCRAWDAGTGYDKLLYAPEDGKTLRCVGGDTGHLLWSIDAQGGDVRDCKMSADGRFALMLTGTTAISLIDARTGRILTDLSGIDVNVISLRFTPDSKKCLASGLDARTVVWDVETGTRLVVCSGSGVGVNCADVSPDGRRLVGANLHGAWELYDASTGRRIMTGPTSAQSLLAAFFTPDGKGIVTLGSDRRVRLWTTVEKDPTVLLDVRNNPVDIPHVNATSQ